MRKSLFAASMLALTVAVVPACATKKFVRTEVGNVNTKVDTVAGSLEQTQERTRQNETRIGSVDAKAEAAGKSAEAANTAAVNAKTAADAAAARANEVGSKVDTVSAEVAATRKLIYEVTLSEDQGNFKFGQTELPDEAKGRLDQMVAQLKTDPKGVFIEIEGHTDNVGSEELNERLGMEPPRRSSAISTSSTRCRCTRST
jgi:outer membrane protein OmpA-like peptidoglycan-associated protein